MYIPESTIFLLEKGLFKIARPDIEHLLKFNKASEESKVVTLSLFERLEAKRQTALEINLRKMKDQEKKNEPSMI